MGWVECYVCTCVMCVCSRNWYGTIIEAETYTTACQLLQFNSIQPPLDVYTIRKMCVHTIPNIYFPFLSIDTRTWLNPSLLLLLLLFVCTETETEKLEPMWHSLCQLYRLILFAWEWLEMRYTTVWKCTVRKWLQRENMSWTHSGEVVVIFDLLFIFMKC